MTPITLTFERFTTNVGAPTCAKNFEIGEVCKFLGTAGMCGRNDVCLFPSEGYPVPVFREGGIGFTQPHSTCPLWNTNSTIKCTATYDVVNVLTGENVTRYSRVFPNILSAVKYFTEPFESDFKYMNVEYFEGDTD